MTWQNLPCAPTLPALFAACPHGWAEIEFTYHAGNPTADPPRDADSSLEVRRLWGIENTDEPALVDLLEDLQEPPLGMPHRDCILLARMEHHAGSCGTCMREPDDEHRPGDPCPRGECGGEFIIEPRLTACWGVDGKPVVYVGGAPVYKPHPDPKPGAGDMWQQVIDRERERVPRQTLACFERRRSDGIAQYGVPLQAGNGRDALREILDETLDRIAYIEQALTERPGHEKSGAWSYLREEQRDDVALVGVLLAEMSRRS